MADSLSPTHGDGEASAAYAQAAPPVMQPNGIAASPNVTASRRARPVKTMKLPLCERSSKTKLVSARSSTIGSTQPLPQSPRCITTTCCYVKNSTIAANSSRYKYTAEPATLRATRGCGLWADQSMQTNGFACGRVPDQVAVKRGSR